MRARLRPDGAPVKYDAVQNPSYVATVVRVTPDDLFALEGLDNLVGYAKFGMQALISKDTEPGLYLLFSTEVKLSEDFVAANNLYRDSTLNADTTKTGYLETNRRVKAIRLRKHQSDSLLIPVESLAYLLKPTDLIEVCEGDVFDSINGKEVCRKYVVKEAKPGSGTKAKARVRRVDDKVFPEHLDSENYFRNMFKVPDHAHVTVSQKLHGTSVRYGVVPALADRTRWERIKDRVLRRVTKRLEHRFIVGSRRVVKSIDLSAEEGKQHYYASGDLWTSYADKNRLADVIPMNHLVYGELVGWTEDGAAIQKDYTYGLPVGEARLYVYRVAMVTDEGRTVDYSAEQMRAFCEDRGLLVVPTLWAGPHHAFFAKDWLERRYYAEWVNLSADFVMAPIPLSDAKLVDEGVCIRYDGPYGAYVLKAKSPTFVQHETKMLDAGTEDLESAEAEATEADLAEVEA